MKVKALSLLVPALLVAGTAHAAEIYNKDGNKLDCLLYTSPSPRDQRGSRMPSSA